MASILAMKPSILVVDEPITGQDYHQGRAMMLLVLIAAVVFGLLTGRIV